MIYRCVRLPSEAKTNIDMLRGQKVAVGEVHSPLIKLLGASRALAS
jgi:hypothetical protein